MKNISGMISILQEIQDMAKALEVSLGFVESGARPNEALDLCFHISAGINRIAKEIEPGEQFPIEIPFDFKIEGFHRGMNTWIATFQLNGRQYLASRLHNHPQWDFVFMERFPLLAIRGIWAALDVECKKFVQQEKDRLMKKSTKD